MFQVLNGPTYTEDNRPPFWKHEKALFLDDINEIKRGALAHAPLADFPLVEDFEVRVEFVSRRFTLEQTEYVVNNTLVYFFSDSLGYLADFPIWIHADAVLSQADFKMPIGDFSHPFYDLEQGWEILIAENDDLVYVIQGESIYSLSYPVWFKVRQDRYLAEWQKAIQACREAFQKQP